jgi:hypothetical protein
MDDLTTLSSLIIVNWGFNCNRRGLGLAGTKVRQAACIRRPLTLIVEALYAKVNGSFVNSF